MAIDLDSLRERVAEIKANVWRAQEGKQLPSNVQAAIQSGISVLTLVYGSDSEQLRAFQKWAQRGHVGVRDSYFPYEFRIASEIGASLDAAVSDFESGLTASVRIQAQGEVLGDFIGLAREALAARSDATDRVAAVLAAAALEETLKRIGAHEGIEV